MEESSETVHLRSELEKERQKTELLCRELQKSKESQIRMAKEKELEEEKISNMLLRKINVLQHEKEQLIQECEREEEFLTNTLQRQLGQLRKEKIDMENALEQEQEMIVNRLQKKLQRLQQPKNFQQNHGYDSRYESSSDEISTISSNETLQKYEELKKQYENQQSLIVNLRTQIDELTQRIEKIRSNNLTLSNASTDLKLLGEDKGEETLFDSLLKKISNLQKDKEQLILEVEQEEEYLTNTLQQRLERILEEKMEMMRSYKKEKEEMIADLQEQIRRLSSGSNSSVEPSQDNPYRQLITDLKRENDGLHKRLAELEKNYREKIFVYEQERKNHQSELSLLRQKIHEEGERSSIASSQRASSERLSEFSDEREIGKPRISPNFSRLTPLPDSFSLSPKTSSATNVPSHSRLSDPLSPLSRRTIALMMRAQDSRSTGIPESDPTFSRTDCETRDESPSKVDHTSIKP